MGELIVLAFVLVLFFSEVNTSTSIQLNPILCDVLFKSRSDCSLSFIGDDLVCLGNTSHQSRFRRPGLLKFNTNKDRKITECLKWTRVNFTTFKGQRCLQVYRRKTDHTREECSTNITSTTKEECLTSKANGHEDPQFVLGGLNMSLHQACAEGNLDVVKYILFKGIEDINSRGKQKMTPVMVAARKAQKAVFDFLVSQGCNLFLFDINSDNILHLSCLGGNVNIVNKLIMSGRYDIEGRGRFGRTPVMRAVSKEQEAVFDFLLSRGCNLTVLDNNKDSVLHLACFGGNVNIVRNLLMTGKYDIESKGRYGRSAIMRAAGKGQKMVFDFLVNKGSDMLTIDESEDNLLHVACLGGNVDIVMKLVDSRNFDINSRGWNRWTPVMKSVFHNHLKVFHYLVSKGCQLNVVDADKHNILHVACLRGHINMVEYIMSLDKVDIDSRGQMERTPVMLAAEEGHKKVFDLLVNKGCSLEILDKGGNNILHVACIGGHIYMVKYVISKDIFNIDSIGQYKRTPVIITAEQGHIGVFKYLISIGCNLSIVDGDQNNILHVACIGGCVDVAKYIISQNISKIDSRGHSNRTPAMIAASKGNIGVLKILVRSNCSLLSIDAGNNTVLHTACIGGHLNIVKYIIFKDTVDINSKGQYERTPVMLAADMGHRDVVGFLVNVGCSRSAIDVSNNNILHVVCLRGDIDMVKYILSLGMVGIESRGQYERTPVMLAVEKGHRSVLNLLVSKGCRLTTKDTEGNNVLHIACFVGNVHMVKYLMAHTDIDEMMKEKNKYGSTPLKVAESMHYADIISLIKDRKL